MRVFRDAAAKHAANRLARVRREIFAIGHIEPDEQPEPVGELEIELVGNFDVAAQRVEAHRLGVAETLFEEIRRCGSRHSSSGYQS